MTTPKITLAAQDNIVGLQTQIDALLVILGHPEALVTDESDFGDFIWLPDRNERQKELDELLQAAGISTKIDIFDTLVTGIRKILADNPGWPKKNTLQ